MHVHVHQEVYKTLKIKIAPEMRMILLKANTAPLPEMGTRLQQMIFIRVNGDKLIQ